MKRSWVGLGLRTVCSLMMLQGALAPQPGYAAAGVLSGRWARQKKSKCYGNQALQHGEIPSFQGDGAEPGTGRNAPLTHRSGHEAAHSGHLAVDVVGPHHRRPRAVRTFHHGAVRNLDPLTF